MEINTLTMTKKITLSLALVGLFASSFSLLATVPTVLTITTEKEFEEKVLKSDKPTIVKFFATWCGPCKRIKTIIDKVAEQNKDVTFVEINIDSFPNLSKKYHVRSVPTIIFLNGPASDKKELDRIIGASVSQQSLNSQIKRVFKVTT